MQDNLQIKTVNVCVYRGDGFDTEFLVMKKARGSQAGLWQFVSGKPEEGETFWQGALRELKEETGCTPERFFEVGAETYYNYKIDKVCINPTFAAEVDLNAEIILSDEHDSFEWLPFDDTILRLPYPSQRETVSRVRFNISDPFGPLPMEIPASVWKDN